MKNKLLKLFHSFILMPTFLIIVIQLCYIKCNNLASAMLPNALLFSIILTVAFSLILFSLTKKSNLSFLIYSLFLAMIFIINQFKIIYEDSPIFISDLHFLRNGKNISKFIGESFFKNFCSITIYIVIIGITLSTLYYLASKIKIVMENKKKRGICLTIGIMMLIILVIPIHKETYSNLFFNQKNYKDYDSYTTYTSLYGLFGIIGGIYYNQFLENNFNIPESYNEEKIESILAQTKTIDSKQTIGTPNIIVILSESFFDVDLLYKNITFDQPITPNFNQLKKEGKKIDLISPTYGGMTANVTFEFLTGANMSFFGTGYIPFMQLSNKNKNYPSITKELQKNGYTCSITLGEDSYHSEKVFKGMGFSHYSLLNSDDKKHIKGQYLSDDYIGDIIIKNINSSSQKNFFMVETMQSHMSYFKEKYNNYDIKVKTSNLKQEDQDVLLSYAQGIYDADKMLKKVYDYIQAIDQETIIIFFGDHLPYLRNKSGENIIKKLDYFNTKNDLENLYRLYNTQGLVLSNYDMNIELPKYLGYDVLLNYIVNHMNITIDPYYTWLYQSTKKLKAYNKYILIDENNKLQYFQNMEKKQTNIMELRHSFIYRNLK